MASFEQEDDRALEFFQFELPGQNDIYETHSVMIGDLKGPSPPLIVLHDGPGTGFEYLRPLIGIWKNYKIPLIFYDQIGCGQSTHYPEKRADETFWTLELYINQLNDLIEHLGLGETGFYLFGHGWGGMLAGEFASRRPKGLQKLIIASGPASMPLYVEGLKTLVASLPGNGENKLADSLKFYDDEDPEVSDLFSHFASRHNYRKRGVGINKDLNSASTNIEAAPEAYLAM
ncbi:Alpha/Beta hydrolase protein [Pestalotiopsis sp. NC0098]|nr:Alpha/Beta hydrolase protein [Pestalotiopsis sp. NC0098]